MTTALSATTTVADRTGFLRTILRENAAFSAACGAIVLIASTGLDSWIGVHAGLLAALGAGLIGYAALLWFGSSPGRPLRPLGWTAVLGDEAWVVGAAAIIFATDWLTAEGDIALGAVSIVVGVFAVLQFIGLRRLSA